VVCRETCRNEEAGQTETKEPPDDVLDELELMKAAKKANAILRKKPGLNQVFGRGLLTAHQTSRLIGELTRHGDSVFTSPIPSLPRRG
jgi:hypothetical protein